MLKKLLFKKNGNAPKVILCLLAVILILPQIFEASGSFENVHIDTNARVIILPEKINVGEYSVKLIDNCFFEKTNETYAIVNETTSESKKCVGYTNQRGEIYIVNNRDISEIVATCNHEILHNVVASDTDEAFVTENFARFMFKECKELKNQLELKNSVM